MKGYLTAITEHNRGGLVNDEITTAYETSHAQHVKGAHLVGKPKMLTFVNGETSVTITGHGHVALDTFAFFEPGVGPVRAPRGSLGAGWHRLQETLQCHVVRPSDTDHRAALWSVT